jgi:hypothetical protein
MNDIAKGGVCTGWDARTVRFVFVHVCVVAWRDSPLPKYLNIAFHEGTWCLRP